MFIIHRNKHKEMIMKKIIATVLCITTVMSFAACNKKKVETVVTGSSSQVTNETYAPVPSATTVANPASEFVKDRIEKFRITMRKNSSITSPSSRSSPLTLIQSTRSFPTLSPNTRKTWKKKTPHIFTALHTSRTLRRTAS